MGRASGSPDGERERKRERKRDEMKHARSKECAESNQCVKRYVNVQTDGWGKCNCETNKFAFCTFFQKKKQNEEFRRTILFPF